VVEESLPETIHDFRVDLIVTPDEAIWCTEPHRPPGILWEHLHQDKIAEVPALAALAARRWDTKATSCTVPQSLELSLLSSATHPAMEVGHLRHRGSISPELDVVGNDNNA
jgi:hypothetical protein